jgi:RHS repeat-associated protein
VINLEIGMPVYEIRYEYDKVGNRLKKVTGSDTTKCTYNNRDQLLTEILGADITSYEYDSNGNTKKKTIGTDISEYQYDAENKLIQAKHNGGLLAEYEYDPDGNRLKKATPMDTTNYLVDPNQALAQVIEEYENGGSLLVAYLYGDDLIKQTRSSTKNYFHYDGLGSTRALTDNLGQLTDTYIFSAFGELLAGTGITENNYLFTGEQFDPNLGFYYLRARFYNPAIGRFLTVDPFPGSIYDPPSLHKYPYCGVDPVNSVDPSGQITIVSAVIVIAIIAVIATAIMLFKKSPWYAMLTPRELNNSEAAKLRSAVEQDFGNFKVGDTTIGQSLQYYLEPFGGPLETKVTKIGPVGFHPRGINNNRIYIREEVFEKALIDLFAIAFGEWQHTIFHPPFAFNEEQASAEFRKWKEIVRQSGEITAFVEDLEH